MLEKFLTYLLYGNSYYGLEYCDDETNEAYIISHLKKKKNSVNIHDNKTANNISEILDYIPKNTPIHLVVNSSKVLNRIVEGSFTDPLKVVNKAFPNLNMKEFYFEVFNQNHSALISICRKEEIDNLVKKLSDQKIWITDFSLGIMPITSIIKYLNTEKIKTSSQIVTMNLGEIVSIDSNETDKDLNSTYNINGISVKSDYLLSLSASLRPVLSNNSTKSNFNKKIDEQLQSYKLSRYRNLVLKFGMIFILSLLLINFLFFNHYFNKVNELNQISQINSDSKETLLFLKNSVEKKETMVNDLINSGNSKSSNYLNSIINLIPESIILSEFNYQPLTKRVKINQSISIEENIIQLSGNSTSGQNFSKFIMALESLSWVHNVDFNYGNGETSGSEFNITILLKDE